MDRIIKIIIPGELPDYNQAIEKAKGDKYGIMYRKWKEATDQKVAWLAKEQLRHLPNIEITVNRTRKGVKFTEVKKVKTMANCAMVVRWYSRARKKDQDNLEHGKKYVMDGLQLAGVIPNDTWKYLGGNTLHEHYIDAENPRIEVYLLENRVLSFSIEEMMSDLIRLSIHKSIES